MVCNTCGNTTFDAAKYLEILDKARILTDSFLAFKGPDMSFACELITAGHLTGKALEAPNGIFKYAVVSGITGKGSAYLLQLRTPATPFARIGGFVAGGLRRIKRALGK